MCGRFSLTTAIDRLLPRLQGELPAELAKRYLIPDGLEQAWLAPVHGPDLRALEPLMQPWDPAGWRLDPIKPAGSPAPGRLPRAAVNPLQLSLDLL